ncbi:class I SAM-dependent methyltransferase [Pelagibius sp. Alg239-R121]|uniref:class I SAM-dependent DNA methyltransferase n=1 Tax=Pelagibius sp. Alg239-R121 TaxID=2993448 RepID=UPI0024A6D73A|nr:class I SAM-dependent methyltransferase [Pelagibius sp. Alg239-R121]
MADGTSETPLASIYETGDEAALEAEYDKWSDSYDADTAAGGYRFPFLVAGFVARYIQSLDAPILDAGAGTGLGGESLAILGYRNLTAIDLSQKMLDRAVPLGAYKHLERMKLGDALGFEDNCFEGVISTGVFTEGHAPTSSFDELIRVTRPGGYIIFTVRDNVYRDKGFQQKQEELTAAGRWKLVEKTEPVRAYTVGEPHIRGFFFIYQVV